MANRLPARVRAAFRYSTLGSGCLLIASCYGDNNYTFAPYWQDNGVVVADFDGDGTPDIAVAQEYVNGPPPHAGYVTVYLQTAAGTFAAPVQYPIGPDPWALAAGDLDGTGHVDLVAVIPGSVRGNPASGEISILHHDPSHPGAFLAAQTLATGGGGDAVAIADVTGDGHADIVVADGSNASSQAILFVQSATTPGTFAAPVSLGLGGNRGANDVTIHDMDGDGRNDIVLAVSDGALILYDNGAGGFQAPVLISAVGANPQGIAVADLDGDGRPDIVVASSGFGPGPGSATILRQTVLGAFTASTINLPFGAVQPVIADLDHDGLPDIAVLSFQGFDDLSVVSVLLQTSASPGTFGLPAAYAATIGGTFMAAGDMNGDGYTDLVVNNPVSLLLQKTSAPGTFGAPVAP